MRASRHLCIWNWALFWQPLFFPWSGCGSFLFFSFELPLLLQRKSYITTSERNCTGDISLRHAHWIPAVMKRSLCLLTPLENIEVCHETFKRGRWALFSMSGKKEKDDISDKIHARFLLHRDFFPRLFFYQVQMLLHSLYIPDNTHRMLTCVLCLHGSGPDSRLVKQSDTVGAMIQLPRVKVNINIKTSWNLEKFSGATPLWATDTFISLSKIAILELNHFYENKTICPRQLRKYSLKKRNAKNTFNFVSLETQTETKRILRRKRQSKKK